MCYLRMIAAFPGFFLSALFVFLLLPVLGNRIGMPELVNISYVDSMLITFIIWVAVAPLAALGAAATRFSRRSHRD
ncbi:MAG: hypothetical protein IKR78_03430 [Dehalococcoidales bacterium]|nr:hypothetical protein [Dehalococcoidales bacterium]